MAIDFSKFDAQVNTEKLAEDIKAAAENNQEFEDTPDGVYTCKVENLEIGETKDGRPMLKVMFRIIEGDLEKRCLFMNRVLFGTKNDGNMIASAIGFLQTLDSGIDVVFESYSQFADLVMDIAEEIDGVLEYEVEYKKDNFQSIKILEVFEV